MILVLTRPSSNIFTFLPKTTMSANNSQQQTLKQIAQEIWEYVKKPTYIPENTNLAVGAKLRYTLKACLINFALIPFIAPLYALVQHLTKAEHILDKESWLLLFSAIILAPIIEEALFRGGLRYNPWVISIWGAILIGTIGWASLPVPYNKIAIFFAFISIGVLYLYSDKNKRKYKVYWKKQFPIIFYIVTLSFALVHLMNYKNVSNYLVAIPLTSFQFIMGLFLGFIRMKFGLRYSIFFHMFWNFTVTFGMLISLIMESDVTI